MNTPFDSTKPPAPSDSQVEGISLSAEETKKDKKRRYKREWKRANREKHNEHNRKSREKNPRPKKERIKKTPEELRAGRVKSYAKYRLANPSRSAAYSRASKAAHREEILKKTSDDRKNNPGKVKERERARCLVRLAVKKGVITKPSVCSRNPDHAGRKVEAHHPNYSLPLDVVWVCRQCHKVLHGYTQHDLNNLPENASYHPAAGTSVFVAGRL